MAACSRCPVSLLRPMQFGRRWEQRSGALGCEVVSRLRVTSGVAGEIGLTRQLSAAAGVGSLSSGKFGPAVKLLLELYGLRNGEVKPSGPHGRLLKGDVLSYVAFNRLQPRAVQVAEPPSLVVAAEAGTATGPSQQLSASERQAAVGKNQPTAGPLPLTAVPLGLASYTDIELTSMRKTIAKRLTQAKMTIPHAYSTADCVIDNILLLRRRLAGDGIKVSVNDFVVKACASALQQVPAMNCIWDGERLVQATSVDVSVAVATDNGLITPIIKDAANLTVEEISAKLKDLSARAKSGKLKLDEFQGGTFTVSNLGMFGISEFSAVINPPQVCILAVGSGRIVPNPDKGTPVTAMTITLSADARAVDDVLVSKFLTVLKAQLEQPYQLGLVRLPAGTATQSPGVGITAVQGGS